ncbi:MAG: YgiT-type zinc finger protein [Nanoarchaeota archaeon]|nr:YgiT-type zinc finger protein [Nanoarchaeota archaeon]
MEQNLIKKCVECGSKDLKTVKKDMELERSNPGTIKISKLEQLQCQNCGESYFDDKQMTELTRKIDQLIKK